MPKNNNSDLDLDVKQESWRNNKNNDAIFLELKYNLINIIKQ